MIVQNRGTVARNKIRRIEDLALTLAAVRTDGKSIVHCHGVFDLLHIGHIRHFEQAKGFGDVLVVTVTADKHVNKGPHRPAFPQELRAEAIAALECVDYVAISHSALAREAILLLRPDFYVKGADYRDSTKDRTGGIVLEEEAVESVGGQIVFTDDITFSSSTLINQHVPIFSSEVRDYLRAFAQRYSAEDVIRYIDGARPLSVLVVGEAIIDEYQYCEAIGKSSKEPTLAVKLLSSEKFAGGILAVANHVANFSDHVSVLTFLGSQNPQEDLIGEKLNSRVERVFLYRDDSPTIVKRRFIDKYFFTKIFETYDINDGALDRADEDVLCALLTNRVPEYDVVIVADFGHGMLTKDAIDILCGKSHFLAVNAQCNAGNLGYHAISRYQRPGYVCIAENEVRLEARDRHGDLRRIVLDVSERLKCGRLVITRGKYGCLCYDEGEGFWEAPALTTTVVDRVGAGDAFLSVTALCAAQGAPMEAIAFIGNAVGAQAVATVGNQVPVERVPLCKQVEALLK